MFESEKVSFATRPKEVFFPKLTNPEVFFSVIQETVKDFSVMFVILTSFGVSSGAAVSSSVFLVLTKKTPTPTPSKRIMIPSMVGNFNC